MWNVFLNGHSRSLFLYFRLFNTVDSKNSIYIFADDWILTASWIGSDHSTNLANTTAIFSKMWMLKMGQLWTSFLITIWWHLFLTTRQNSKLDWLSGRPSIINTAAALQFFLFNQHQFSGKAEPLTFYNSKSSHCVYHWWWRPIELEQP